VARPALEQAEMTCIPGFRALITSAISIVVGWNLLNVTVTPSLRVFHITELEANTTSAEIRNGQWGCRRSGVMSV